MERKPTAAARQPALLTLSTIAAETGVPYTSVRQWVIGGHLAHVRLGASKRTWVRRDDLERFIAASTEPASR